jgi:hypothetical protein
MLFLPGAAAAFRPSRDCVPDYNDMVVSNFQSWRSASRTSGTAMRNLRALDEPAQVMRGRFCPRAAAHCRALQKSII